MTGQDATGNMEYKSGNVKQDLKHWMIAASAGEYQAMYHLQIELEQYVLSVGLRSTQL